MLRYLSTRVSQLILVLFAVSILVFIFTSVMGNPVYLMVRENATEAEIQAAIEYLGLDKPLPVQYGIFIKNALKGDFGKSYIYHQPALGLIMERFPATLELVFIAMLLSALIGIPLGVLSGAYPNKISSKAIMTLSIAGISLPSFWIGMVMIFFFSLTLGILPVSGRGDIGTILGLQTSLATTNGLRHLVLPSLTLALANIATIIRLTRAGMQENIRQDYVKFARAKGVSSRKVLFGHALKNTLIPVVTIFGLQLGSLIAFTTITETIFAWPGMGKLLIDAINSADRPIVAAYVLFVAVMFVFINFIVDILYTFIDPRIDLK
ncbi:ABC transporter permease [Paramaledivibacter caminithermalis]|jgi:peptide/nickel transport system permease protein|uniref:Peptide/nickel transport system permease protein n=1 Tax=Paramaledivibacter caminithermalis (strain DSM 15212 / CIP 107654 / DViRD3) TaxID=1121301 RepID=A0A1M6P0A1_PARC5|nr:ABC transporter permease [Paramaledivibacter caminithermalis]SHK01351.1 peptide/nickel transport system permease protein [Paramaledivibacter caminithermalis DSM 15212]